jgi:ABC-type uncharacterized transport system permease subunit
VAGTLLIGLAALAALLPAALLPEERRDGPGFSTALALAVAGPALFVLAQVGAGWRTGVAAAIWLGIVFSLALFAPLALASAAARRLTRLLFGYLAGLGALALLWQHAPARPLPLPLPAGWLQAHIVVALVAYGLLTLAAVAGAAVVLQERALKARRPTAFSRGLPAVADGERLQTRLLMATEAVLAVALATGVVLTRAEGGGWIRIDHKTVLSLLAFALIGALLLVHRRFGLGGRRAARYGLVGYLLLTLAYPGVKFVTDVLLGRGA